MRGGRARSAFRRGRRRPLFVEVQTDMELVTLLQQNREDILGQWTERVIRTYPAHTSQFLAKQKDRFQNPVGHTIEQGLEAVYDEIISTMDTEKLSEALDGVVRIRAVQDFTASQAVEFVFELKAVIRRAVHDAPEGLDNPNLLGDVEMRIDRVALLAFDKYMECRETLHKVQIDEIKNRSTRLLDRINVKPEGTPPEKKNDDDV